MWGYVLSSIGNNIVVAVVIEDGCTRPSELFDGKILYGITVILGIAYKNNGQLKCDVLLTCKGYETDAKFVAVDEFAAFCFSL